MENPMPGNSPAALSGQVHVDVNVPDDALDPVELQIETEGRKRSAGAADDKDKIEDQDRQDQDDQRGRGEEDDEDGYSPEQARIRAARRGERKAKTRSQRLEREVVRLASEVEGLRDVAQKGVEGTAKKRMEDAQARYNDAWNRRTKAFDEGKSADWNKAEADIKVAEAEYAEATRQAAAAQERSAGPTSVLKDWMQDNDWFDIDGGDENSKLAIQLSREIAKDGFAPKSQAHFDELDRRLRKRAPKLFDGDSQDGGADYDRQEQDRETRRNGGERERPQRQGQGQDRDRGPRGVLGSDRSDRVIDRTDSRKNTKVPRELIRSYQAAGMDVNDPKVKQRMLNYYNEHLSRSGGVINVG